MAVYSMTGFASAQSADPLKGIQHSVEIRSVNSRFLDISFRLPDEWRHTEPALRTLITQHIKRGKVELRASAENITSDLLTAPSTTFLQALMNVENVIKTTLPNARELSIADVLRLAQGQKSQAASATDVKTDTQAFVQLTQSVITELLQARLREGERLADMLFDRITQLRVLADAAGPMIPALVAAQKQKFLDRWKEALTLGNTSEQTSSSVTEQAAMDRALSESTAFAIRIDVAEELTRMRSHLDEIERLLNLGGENGKRLDFLIQELHREANTLGSKSSVLELSRISVEMKVLIEQMREQVQNIE